jgi:uncharacterized phage protein (TIGR02218 family)
MLTLTAELLAHHRQALTSLAVCWRITRGDAVQIMGTEHDRDIVIDTGILSGAYFAASGITGSSVRSSSDMSADNMEVSGALAATEELSITDLSSLEIEAGLFDDAEVVLFTVNWAAPNEGQRVIRTGNLGEIIRTSEGKYRTELRGLGQRLTQKMGRTYSSGCDAELGDSRCTVDLGPYTVTGTVTAVTSNRRFAVGYDTSAQENGFYIGGVLTWTSGDNDTFGMEIKLDAAGGVAGEIQLYLPMPRDIQVGDTFQMTPGCDKTPAMCKARFDNLLNFRGHGAWVPGLGEVMAFGGQTAEKKPVPDDFWEVTTPIQP